MDEAAPELEQPLAVVVVRFDTAPPLFDRLPGEVVLQSQVATGRPLIRRQVELSCVSSWL